jgi:hypothetical protein
MHTECVVVSYLTVSYRKPEDGMKNDSIAPREASWILAGSMQPLIRSSPVHANRLHCGLKRETEAALCPHPAVWCDVRR